MIIMSTFRIWTNLTPLFTILPFQIQTFVFFFFFLGSFSDRNSDARSFLRGLDVNRMPPSAAAAVAAATADCYEEENGVSSPNSTVSSISGKRSEREAALGGEEAEEGDRDSCSRGGGSDDDDGGNGSGDASRKKLRLTKDQSLVLEETFKEHNTLNPVSSLSSLLLPFHKGISVFSNVIVKILLK